MSGNSSRKIGHNKNSPSMANYKAQDRLSKNKRRRLAAEQRRVAAYAATAAHRKHLRQKGALARIDRRISEATGNTARLGFLMTIRTKVSAAAKAGAA